MRKPLGHSARADASRGVNHRHDTPAPKEEAKHGEGSKHAHTHTHTHVSAPARTSVRSFRSFRSPIHDHHLIRSKSTSERLQPYVRTAFGEEAQKNTVTSTIALSPRQPCCPEMSLSLHLNPLAALPACRRPGGAEHDRPPHHPFFSSPAFRLCV